MRPGLKFMRCDNWFRATAAQPPKKEVEWDQSKPNAFGPTVGSRAALQAAAEKAAATAAATTAAAAAAQAQRSSWMDSSRSLGGESASGSPGGSPSAHAVWHVDVAEAPPLEVSEPMLMTLEPSALVWTQGMSDWLPLGDLPPPAELPPAPAGTQEAAAAAAARRRR